MGACIYTNLSSFPDLQRGQHGGLKKCGQICGWNLIRNPQRVLRADKKNDCTVVVNGKANKRGDGKGMQVPCTLNFKGHRKWIDILKKELIGKD